MYNVNVLTFWHKGQALLVNSHRTFFTKVDPVGIGLLALVTIPTVALTFLENKGQIGMIFSFVF